MCVSVLWLAWWSPGSSIVVCLPQTLYLTSGGRLACWTRRSFTGLTESSRSTTSVVPPTMLVLKLSIQNSCDHGDLNTGLHAQQALDLLSHCPRPHNHAFLTLIKFNLLIFFFWIKLLASFLRTCFEQWFNYIWYICTHLWERGERNGIIGFYF